MTSSKATGEPVQVVVAAGDDKRVTAEVLRQTLDGRQRALRALKGFAACWLLAIPSVLLPLAHFVLVPGFIIAGPIVAIKRLGQERLILGTTLKCPACGGDAVLKQAIEVWPLGRDCSSCGQHLKIEPAPDPTPDAALSA